MQDREASEGWGSGQVNVGQLRGAMTSLHALTLHAIDCPYYKVASLMDQTPMEDLMYYKDRRLGYDFNASYGFCLPRLYGVPPKFSPSYRKLTERDFEQYDVGGGDYDYNGPLDHMGFRGALLLDHQWEDDDRDSAIVLNHPQKGLNFGFLGSEGESSIQWPHHVCSYLRAMMKEKCVQIEAPSVLTVSADDVQQPFWVGTEKIIDTVLSYSSFEDQAGKLRLVCRQFDASALHQLERKLDKIKVIGFMRDGEGCGNNWFKATVRRGWTDKCLTSKESAVDDALWLASCRCFFDYCEDKESCQNVDNPLKCLGYSSKHKKTMSKTPNMDRVRKQLSDKGRAVLTDMDPDDFSYKCDDYSGPSNMVECSFKRQEMNLFELCRKVAKSIDKKTDAYGCLDEGELPNLNGHLKSDYGVSMVITSRQFVRSIFLVFARAKGKTNASGDESAVKKARSAPVEEVTVGMAKSNISVKNGGHSRMKKIIRFYSAANEQMEICLESRSSYSY